MVAIATGNGLGVSSGSLVLGGGSLGRSGEQSYLNVVNGNLVLQGQDELLLGRGPDLSVVRTYNSQGAFNDDNGDNWRIGFYRRLSGLTGTVNTAGSTIVRTGADGAALTHSYDTGRGLYLNTDGAGSYDTLSYNSSTSQWTWTDGDSRITETYDWASGAGKLLSLADTNGNTITYGYTSNLLTSVTSANHTSGNQNITYLDYTGTLLQQVRTVAWDGTSNQTLTRTRYGYDSSNRLVSVTVDLSPNDNSISDGKTYVTSYSYDSSNRVIGITQTDGTQIAYTYDGAGKISQITQALASGETRTTTISYNTSTRKTTVTDPLGNATVYTYDTAGQLTNILAPAVGGVSQSVSYGYNSTGDLTSQTDARGQTISYTYDANGNLTLQRDAAGNTVTRTWGSKNELLTETVYLTPDPDGAGSASASQPLTTRYVYDSENHLRFAISAEGRVTEYRYDTPGNRTTSISYTGNLYTASPFAESDLASWVSSSADKSRSVRSDYAYDFRGQITSSTVYASVDSTGAGVADGTQSTTQYVYDQAGNLLKTIAPKGVATTGLATDFVTTYGYDGLGRLLSTTDTLGRVTQTQYDDAGNKTIATLANGLVTTSSYNKAGELISVTQADGATALGTASYAYDADGHLRMTTDATGVKTYVLYDEASRKVADIEGDGSLIEYLYNANNQLIRTIRYATAVSAAGLASLVDGAGKPANVTLASLRPASNAADRSAWNFYDAANRLVKRVDELGFVTQSFYDGAGRVTDTVRYNTAVNTSAISESTTWSDAAVSPSGNAEDRYSRNFFDADGKLIGSLDAEGYLVEHQYDAAGRLVHVVGYANKASSGYWSTAMLAALRPPVDPARDQHVWSFYDGRGNVIATLDAEGYLTETQYDLNGNKTSQTRYASKALIAPQSITSTTTLAALRPATHAQDQTCSWIWNELNQLAVQTDYQGTVTVFTYDTVGNLIRSDKAFGTTEIRTGTTRYDKQGRVLGELSGEGSAALAALGATPTQAQIDAVWSNWGASYAYDQAGRRISVTDANGNRSLFYYNSDGKLAYAINAAGEVSENQYNAFNELTRTINYGSRIATAGLNGGLVTSAVANAVSALADASLDSVQDQTYTLRGQIENALDAGGASTSFAYDAFGDKILQTQQIDGSSAVQTQSFYDHRGALIRTHLNAADAAFVDTQGRYDAFGRITQTIDGNGKINRTVYDRLGRAVQTIDALGASSTTTYDAFSRVLTQTDALSNTTSFAYNASTRAVTLTTPDGVSVTTTSNRLGEVISTRDGNGNTITNSYDRDGRLNSTTDALGNTQSSSHDHAGRLLETIDPLGVKTDYTYDAAGRMLTRTVDPGGLNLVTTYAYDAKGQTLSVTDPAGIVTRMRYDRKGQVTQVVVDPDGINAVTSYTYDLRGKKLSVTEAAGTTGTRTTQYTYDKLGRLILQQIDPAGLSLGTRFEYDASNNLIKRIDAGGNVTRYYYDDDNRLVYTLDPANGLTQTSYDADGRVVGTLQYVAALAGLTSFSLTDVQSHIVANAGKDRSNRTVFDAAGRAVYAVDATGAVAERRYDANGNVVQTIQYARPVTAAWTNLASLQALIQNDPADRINRAVFDAAGRLVYAIDPAGTVTRRDHDADGNLVAVTHYANPISLSGLGNVPSLLDIATRLVPDSSRDAVTRTVYDTSGRAVFVVNAMGGVTRSIYDADGRVLEKIGYARPIPVSTPMTLAGVSAAISADPTDHSLRQVFDKLGRVVFVIDAMGYVTHNRYDASDNISSTTQYDNPVSLTGEPDIASVANALVPSSQDRTTRNYYDAAGRQIYAIDALGHARQTDYDAMGQVVRIVQYAGQIVPGSWSLEDVVSAIAAIADATQDQATRIQYDAAGRQIALTDALGQSESYSYDALGDKLSFTNKKGSVWTYAYDQVGRTIQEITPAVSVTRITQNADGTVTPVTTTESIVTAIGYDTFGNVNTRTEASGTPDARTTTYVYDLVGHQIQTINPVTSVYDATADQAASYLDRHETVVTPTSTTYYDALGRAYANRDVSGVFAYKVYDQSGRVRYEIDAERYVTQYTYDAFNNQLTLTRYANALSASLFAARESTASSTSLQGFTLADMAAAVVTIQSGQDRTVTNSFDKLSHIIQTQQTAVFNYDSSADGTPAATFTAAPTTQNFYNAFGQLIRQSNLKNPGVDGLIGTVDDQWIDIWSYYDDAGRKVAQIDALGYLSTWQYDAVGNVTRVEEYARALSRIDTGVLIAGTFNATGYIAIDTLPDNATSMSDIGFDRITTSTYDQLNRKIADTRVGVQYASDASGNEPQLGDLTTRYTYDALGNSTSVRDATGATTYTYYDVLGRTVASAQPQRTASGIQSETLPPLSVSSVYLGISFSSRQAYVATVSSDDGDYYGSELEHRIDLNWNSLDKWGDGRVRVTVYYNGTSQKQTLSSINGMTGATFEWTGGAAISSVTRVVIEKEVAGGNDKWFVVQDRAQEGFYGQEITWAPPITTGTTATFGYRIAGTGNSWTNLPATLLGSRYRVDISILPAGQYEYQLSYRQATDTAVSSQGSGVFTVTAASSATASTVAARTEAPYLSVSYSNGGATVAEHRVDLSWSSLEGWGDGRVRVTIYYNGTSMTKVLNAADGLVGTFIAWAGGDAVNLTRTVVEKETGNGSLSWVTVHDTNTSEHQARLLLNGAVAGMTGVNIAGVGVRPAHLLMPGLYEVDISDLPSGTYTYTPIGTASTAGGSFQARKTGTSGVPAVQEQRSYIGANYTNHVAYTAPDVFEYGGHRSLTGQYSTVFAHRIDLTWNSLEDRGDGRVRVTVDFNGTSLSQTLTAANGMTGTTFDWTGGDNISGITHVLIEKETANGSGQWVKANDRSGNDWQDYQLTITNLPATAKTVTLEYRPSDSADVFLPATPATRLNDGVFTLKYADIPNGSYEYRLTVRDTSGNPVDLTSEGGNALGQINGHIDILRGGQSQPVMTTFAAPLTPLTMLKLNVFGNAVQQTSYANGASSATVSGYAVAGVDATNDQTTYNVFDSYGHILRSVDALGNSNYSSYALNGSVAKSWHTITDVDGNSQQVSQLVFYDRLGHQTTAKDISTGTAASTSAGVLAPSLMPVLTTTSATYVSGWTGTNSITLNWSSLAYLGSGAVQVIIDYVGRDAGNNLRSAQKTGSASDTSMSLSWGGEALASIARIRITKSISGTVQTVYDSSVATVRDSAPALVSTATAGYELISEGYWDYGWHDPVYGWAGNSSVRFTWGALDDLGDGNVEVGIDYIGVDSGGHTYSASRTQTFNTTSSLTGATMIWGEEGLNSVTHFRIWKWVNGTRLLIADKTLDASTIRLMPGLAPKSTVTSAATYNQVGNGYWDYGGYHDPVYAWVGTNSVNLQWSSLAVLGNGDVQIAIDSAVRDANGNSHTISRMQTFSGAASATGATVSWSGEGVVAVAGVRIWKMIGTERRLIYDSSSGVLPGQTRLSWQALPIPFLTTVLRYRLSGSTAAWTEVRNSGSPDDTLLLANSRYVMNLAGLTSGASYDYQVIHTRSGDTTPYAGSQGTFIYGAGKISAPQALAPVVSINSAEARFNSFGETAAKGSDGGWQEHFLYDNAGRLWESNQGDGEEQILLYNLQGKSTASIRGTTTDLHALADASQAIALAPAAVRRTETIYDVLGRAIEQRQPSFSEAIQTIYLSSAVVSVHEIAPLMTGTTSAAYGLLSDGYWDYGGWHDPVYGWEGSNSVSFAWNAMDDLGNGNIDISVDYVARDENGRTYNNSCTQSFGAPASLTNLKVSWSGEALVNVTRYRIWKWDKGARYLIGEKTLDASTTQTIAGFTVNSQIASSSSYDLVGYNDYWSYGGPWNHVPVFAWRGTSSVNLQWNSLASLGNGNVQVAIDYTTHDTNGNLHTSTRMQTLSSASGLTGTNFSWAGGEDVVGILNVRIWKMVGNERRQIYDSSIGTPAAIPAQIHLSWQVHPLAGVAAVLHYRRSGTTDPWTELKYSGAASDTLNVINSRYVANIGGLIPGAGYDYEILYFRPGESSIYAGGQGSFINTAGNTSTPVSLGMSTPTLTPTVYQTVDRWGNVLSASDPRYASWITSYRYDSSNQVVEQDSALTDVWRVDGKSVRARASTLTSYDSRGLVVATVDANGNRSSKRYDEVGQLVAEYHADGGMEKHTYDAFGRETSHTDGVGHTTSYTYNRNGWMTGTYQPLSSISYAYDQSGHRISVTNAAGETMRYIYDMHGNVIMTRLPTGGADINTRYYTVATYDTQGRKIAEGNGNGDYQTWTYNYFGQLQSHRDLGGVITKYTYNAYSGDLLKQTSSRDQNIVYTYYENGQQKTVTDLTLNTETYYEIDAAGHHTRERFKRLDTGLVYQEVCTNYDELGRVHSVVDNRYGMEYDYDALGNRRRTYAVYLDAQNKPQTSEYWYTYDAMNRINISQGVLVDGTIGIRAKSGSGSSLVTAQGTILSYDAAGNRRLAQFYETTSDLVNEAYTYDANNRLTGTNRAGQLTSARAYDLAGRVIDITSYSSPGTISNRQITRYNANGWVLQQDIYDKSGTHTQQTRFYDGSDTVGNYDAVGSGTRYYMQSFQSQGYTNTYNKTYAKYDGYREVTVAVSSTAPSTPGTTTETYDVNGNLVSVTDAKDSTKNRTFVNTTQGLLLQKTQNGQNEYYFYANGNPVGSAGDLGGNNASFDYNYTPVSDAYPSSVPSSYVVSQGDTLRSISAAVFGDPSLWYIIADANGLRTDADLRIGQTLTIPSKISNLYNNAGTHKVYNPGEIIGDTTPTLGEPPPPPPARGPKCSQLQMVIGSILIAILTTVLSVATMGAAIPAITTAYLTAPAVFLCAITGAAVGAGTSLLGQGAKVLFGMQDKISWSEVGIGAITGAISGAAQGAGAISAVGKTLTDLQKFGTGLLTNMITMPLDNVVTQGVNIATGKQDKFNWNGVAAAVLTAPIAAALGTAAGRMDGLIPAGSIALKGLSNFAFGLTTSVVSQAISTGFTGGKMDLAQTLADSFGNAIGNTLVEGARYGQESRERMQNAMRSFDLFGTPDMPASTIGLPPPTTSDWGNQFNSPTGIGFGSSATSSGNGSGQQTVGLQAPALMQSSVTPTIQQRKINQGDCFWSVARDQLGSEAADADIQNQVYALMQINPGMDPRLLQPGQNINVVAPKSGVEISAETITNYQKSNSELKAYEEYINSCEDVSSSMYKNDDIWKLLGAAGAAGLLTPSAEVPTTGGRSVVRLANGDVFYIIDDATGGTIRASGVIEGSHPNRSKGTLPKMLTLPGDERGHLIPESGVADPKAVNIKPNLISEAMRSNRSPKARLDRYARGLADINPGAEVVFSAEPQGTVGSRPFANTYAITLDGKVVIAQSIYNRNMGPGTVKGIKIMPPSVEPWTEPLDMFLTSGASSSLGSRSLTLGDGLRLGGKALTVLGAVNDGYRIVQSYRESQQTGDWSIAGRTTAEVGGGWFGGFLASAGACALVGSEVPLVGTITGFVAGGIGYALGADIGKTIYEAPKKIEEGVNTIYRTVTSGMPNPWSRW